MKYEVLFPLKNSENIFKSAVCCSRDWHLEGSNTFCTYPELQLRRGNGQLRDNFLNFSIKSVSCDLSIEPSCKEGAYDGSKLMLSLINMKNYL